MNRPVLADRPTLLYLIKFLTDGAHYWGITYKTLTRRLAGHRRACSEVGDRLRAGERYEAQVVRRFPNRTLAEQAEQAVIHSTALAGVPVLNWNYNPVDEDECACECRCPEDPEDIYENCECYDECECWDEQPADLIGAWQ